MTSNGDLTSKDIDNVSNILRKSGFDNDKVTQITDSLKRGSEYSGTIKDNLSIAQENASLMFDPAQLSTFSLKIDEIKEKARTAFQTPGITESSILGLSSAFLKVRDDFRELDLTWGSAAGYKTLMSRYDELKQSLATSSPESLTKGSGIFSQYLSESERAKLSVGKDEAAKASAIREAIGKSIELAKQQEMLAQSILYQAGQTGTLDKLFEKTSGQTESFEKLNEYVAKYNMLITQSGISTGLARSEVVKYYEKLNVIPGAMDQIVAGMQGTNQSMLETMITLSRGANIPFEKLSDIASSLRNNFNMIFGEGKESAGKDAMEFMASMSKASRSLGLDFDSLNSNISSISSSFRMYGNTSKDVVSSFYQIAKGLEETGLSAKSSGEMAQSYISHFSELTMAQKSYISQMSGGPGGLRGAFQIEEDLRKGDFKSVFEKFQSTLQKQVGPIVSGEEASQSEAAASRRMLQMQILQSGPLGSLAKDPTSAGRLLDAMSQSAKGLAPLEEASKSLGDLYKIGKERQGREGNIGTIVQSGFDEVRSLAEIIAYNTTQLAFGNPARGTAIGDVASTSENIKKTMKEVQREAAEAGAALRKEKVLPASSHEMIVEGASRAGGIAVGGATSSLKDAANTAEKILRSAGQSDLASQLKGLIGKGDTEGIKDFFQQHKMDASTGQVSAAQEQQQLQVIQAAVKVEEDTAKKTAADTVSTKTAEEKTATVSKVVCSSCNATLLQRAVAFACAVHGQGSAASGQAPAAPDFTTA